MDLKDAQQIKIIFEKIYEDHQDINILINSAAIFETTRFSTQGFEKISEILDTNLKGVIFTTRCVIERMIQKKSGRIINISSVSGCRGIENQAVYSASKHALVGFAESLSQELANTGVQITTLCPGGIDTPLWNETNLYKGDKRQLLTAADVCRLILFISEQPSRIIFKSVVFYPSNEAH